MKTYYEAQTNPYLNLFQTYIKFSDFNKSNNKNNRFTYYKMDITNYPKYHIDFHITSYCRIDVSNVESEDDNVHYSVCHNSIGMIRDNLDIVDSDAWFITTYIDTHDICTKDSIKYYKLRLLHLALNTITTRVDDKYIKDKFIKMVRDEITRLLRTFKTVDQ